MSDLGCDSSQLVLFDSPKRIKLAELSEFLKKYQLDNSVDIFACQQFSYGDFDNKVTAIIYTMGVSPRFSHYYSEDKGIYEAGDTSFCIETAFWVYSPNRKFWKECPKLGYGDDYRAKVITDIEVTIDGYFQISYTDR